jgi:DNA-binding CsgD family transcriptional regulator
MRAPLAAAVALVERLGSPVWSAHVHWAGIQQGILLSRPAELTPYARALVAAGHGSRVAAAMARAGRVWTAVLGGSVDPDAVESAADALAEVGLAWDGARLAGHGASRTDDRRIAARLLARARELHPTDATRRPAGGDQPATAADDLLSERELEVARLVVQGRTYAEIGAAIFISPRTAEHHIAHIRRRLGATSRSDLIGKLRALLAEETDPRGAGESSPVLTPAGIGVPPDADGRSTS